jgi:hypothetical protein
MADCREYASKARRSPYVWMLLMFLVLQISLGFLTDPNHYYWNLRWYQGVAEQMHNKGFFEVWTPYPPVFPALLYVCSGILGTGEALDLLWKVLNVILVVAIASVIYLSIRRRSKEAALAAAFGYLLVNATWNSAIAVGFYIDQYDYLPVLMMMLSLYLLMEGKTISSALACGISAMIKLFPAVVLPVALISLDRRNRVRYLLFFALACFVVVLPFLVVNVEPLLSFYRFTATRDGWETVWIFPDIGFPPTPSPESLATPFDGDAYSYGWLTWIMVASALVYMYWQIKVQTETAAPKRVLVLLLIYLIFSKGVSSYHVFWIFPLLFVVYRSVYAFAICAAFLFVGNIEFANASINPSTYWLSIFMRHAMFVALLIHQLPEWDARSHHRAMRVALRKPLLQ